AGKAAYHNTIIKSCFFVITSARISQRHSKGFCVFHLIVFDSEVRSISGLSKVPKAQNRQCGMFLSAHMLWRSRPETHLSAINVCLEKRILARATQPAGTCTAGSDAVCTCAL
ncbi:hypothetical protein BaRGS_00028932, partial [Batillaria attramentaria]